MAVISEIAKYWFVDWKLKQRTQYFTWVKNVYMDSEISTPLQNSSVCIWTQKFFASPQHFSSEFFAQIRTLVYCVACCINAAVGRSYTFCDQFRNRTIEVRYTSLKPWEFTRLQLTWKNEESYTRQRWIWGFQFFPKNHINRHFFWATVPFFKSWSNCNYIILFQESSWSFFPIFENGRMCRDLQKIECHKIFTIFVRIAFRDRPASNFNVDVSAVAVKLYTSAPVVVLHVSSNTSWSFVRWTNFHVLVFPMFSALKTAETFACPISVPLVTYF